MDWNIYDNNSNLITTIIQAEESFIKRYCSENNYSYSRVKDVNWATEQITSLEEENKLLKAQIQAQSDQLDFYEECIAEMAEVVYA